METISENNGLLTNLEVAQLIEGRKKTRDRWAKSAIEIQHRVACEYKTLEYIKQNEVGAWSMAKLSLLLAKLQSLHLQLSEEEIVQIANSLPETEVEVYLMIQNCSDRFTDDNVQEIINLVRSFKQPKPDASIGGSDSAMNDS